MIRKIGFLFLLGFGHFAFADGPIENIELPSELKEVFSSAQYAEALQNAHQEIQLGTFDTIRIKNILIDRNQKWSPALTIDLEKVEVHILPGDGATVKHTDHGKIEALYAMSRLGSHLSSVTYIPLVQNE